MKNDPTTPFIPSAMAEEIDLHTAKIQAEMPAESAILISSNVNILYSSGRMFRGYVWVPSEGRPLFFVVRPQLFSESEALIYIRKPEQIAEELEKRSVAVPPQVGLELDTLTYNEAQRLMKCFPGREFFNATPALRGARMVKTARELELMRVDGRKQAHVYSLISGLYRPGMTDLQLQIAIERQLRLEGSLGFTRVAGNLMEINMGSVLAGDNANNPSPYEFAMGGAGSDPSLPGGADGTLIVKGTTVMVDMNGAFNAYQTDMTRIWTLGDLPELAYRAHACSIEILRTLEVFATPGREVCELYFLAVDIAEKAGLQSFFMGHRQKSNFIGHGVGLELNEQPPVAPRCRVTLKEGMTLALEPKFVLPGIGAVGVENTYAVKKEGLENLTPLSEDIFTFNG